MRLAWYHDLKRDYWGADLEPTTIRFDSRDEGERAQKLTAIVDAGEAVDLHCHTRHSDGDWTPSELVHDASKLGLRLLSLTDHDTVGGQAEASGAADAAGLLFLTGMEVSLSVEGRLYHVLCFDYDPSSPVWERFANGRRNRQQLYQLDLFDQLRARGYTVSPDSARGSDGRFVPNPLAEALHRSGGAPSVEAAQQVIRGLYLQPRIELTYQDVAEFGELLQPGAAVFSVAHPGRQQQGVSVRLSEDDLRTFQKTIPLVALEATHPYHSSDDVVHFAELAAKNGLAVTCGSDAHGLRQRRPLQKYPAILCRDFLELIRDRWVERAQKRVLVHAS